MMRTWIKLVVDVSIPTETVLTERRPDFTSHHIISHHSPSKRAVIFVVACAWEPLILEREAEKRNKYQRFATDLASQLRCWKVTVHPLVMGYLGSVCGSVGIGSMNHPTATKHSLSHLVEQLFHVPAGYILWWSPGTQTWLLNAYVSLSRLWS